MKLGRKRFKDGLVRSVLVSSILTIGMFTAACGALNTVVSDDSPLKPWVAPSQKSVAGRLERKVGEVMAQINVKIDNLKDCPACDGEVAKLRDLQRKLKRAKKKLDTAKIYMRSNKASQAQALIDEVAEVLVQVEVKLLDIDESCLEECDDEDPAIPGDPPHSGNESGDTSRNLSFDPGTAGSGGPSGGSGATLSSPQTADEIIIETIADALLSREVVRSTVIQSDGVVVATAEDQRSDGLGGSIEITMQENRDGELEFVLVVYDQETTGFPIPVARKKETHANEAGNDVCYLASFFKVTMDELAGSDLDVCSQ